MTISEQTNAENFPQDNKDLLQLSPNQQDIHNGLRNIGEEIATFYLDGIKIIKDNTLKTKSYLLAHILREIEGGLRDILVVSEASPEKCPQGNRVETEKKGHIDRICFALGVSKDDRLAQRWHKLAKEFHKYAHRRGAWSSPREAEEVIALWNEFEIILFALVGTYLNLLDRVKRILGYEFPSEQIIKTLKNILSTEALHSYFFKNLRSPKWLVPLKAAGFFDPKNNPPPEEVPEQPGYFTIPYWSILSYLEIISKEDRKTRDKEISQTLLEIVNDIITCRDKNGDRIHNYKTDWIMLIVISNLPSDLMSEQHIEFIRDSLHSKWGSNLVESDLGKELIPVLIKDNRKDLLCQLVDVMLDYKKLDDHFGDKYFPLMDSYWLAEILKKHKPDIAKLCGIEAAKKALDKMKHILAEDDTRFHNYLISTIEDHPQTHFPERYEVQVVQFVRDMYEYYPNPEEIWDNVKSLLLEKHPIFRRIAFHIINKHYDALKALFVEYEGNPLETLVTHEIYELLKDHCKDFSDEEIDKILDWIEREPLPDEILKDEKHTSHIRKEWLHALLCSENVKAQKQYDYHNAVFPYELTHPGHHYWMESGSVGDESPITADELGSKSNAEIAKYLKEFKGEGKFVWGKLSEISLTNTIKQCVINNPEKFSNDLKPFLDIQSLYVVRILWGLAEVWRNKRDFAWDELIDFMWQLIEPNSFWEERSENVNENYRNSVIQAIADIMKEGTQSDEHAFNPELLSKAKKVLLQLLEKAESDLGNITNIVTSVLNSTKGHIYEALVNYSLRYARLYKKAVENRLDDEIKAEFTKRLDRQIESTLEFSVILGQYLPNLIYLDKQWVTDNIDRIFPKDNPTHWEASMCGYLYAANKVYEVIYQLLKSSGNFERALDTDFNDKFAIERLVQHISISFLEGGESLDDPSSLLVKVLEKLNPEQLRQLTGFPWTLRGTLKPTQKEKVKQLWGKIMDVVTDRLDRSEFKPLASNLARWLSLVDKIDNDIYKWMIKLVKYLDKDHFNNFVIEYLLIHIGQTPKLVGEICIEMLTNGIYPLYKEENIKELVEKLYASHPDLAERICNMYGEQGHVEILEDVYKKYHRPA